MNRILVRVNFGREPREFCRCRD